MELKKVFLILLFLIGLDAKAQGDLASLLETAGSSIYVKSMATDQLHAFVKSVSSKHRKESRQLRKIFNGMHNRFLKKYEAYSDFDEIFSSGHYDCLTATALFSNVLDQLHYSYDIIETNYHIFLMIQTSSGEVMIETTDPFRGFITSKEAIAQRIQEYRKNIPSVNHSSGYLYQYSFSLCQEISEENLSGLLTFNQAVKAYNRHDWVACVSLLEKANRQYSSPRCESLGLLLIQTISESSLEENIKTDCLTRLKSFRLKKSDSFASN